MKRFLSEDPVGFFGGDVNFYSYVFNSPLTYQDPFGLCPMCLAPVAPAVIAGATAAGEAVAGLIIGAIIGDVIVDSIHRSDLKGDDPGFQSEEERQKRLKEARDTLNDPDASQREKSKAKKRIDQLRKEKSKRAHQNERKNKSIIPPIFPGDPDQPITPPLGCRKEC